MILAEVDYKRAQAVFPIRSQCNQLEWAIDLYKANNGSFPSTTNGLGFLLLDEDCRKLLNNTNLVDPWGQTIQIQG
jgi:hypothetical protein